jgi:hypothetical protein
MKQFIFALSVTLLFSTVSTDAHAYTVKMMSLRVWAMWLFHLMKITGTDTLLEICRMLLHLPFAIVFTMLALRVELGDPSLCLLAVGFLFFDCLHSLTAGLVLGQEFWQNGGPLTR